MPSTVRPELGPTLGELVGPRVAHWPKAVRVGLVALLVAAVVAAVVARKVSSDSGVVEVVKGSPAFNLIHPGSLRRRAPLAGERLRLEGGGPDPATFTVSTMALPRYNGIPDVELPVLVGVLEQVMRSTDTTFRLRGEGRTRINDNPGYQINYQVTRDGRTTYGRRVLLYDSTVAHPLSVLDVTLLLARSPQNPNAAAVGATGPIKTALRSLRFGTQRP